MDQICVNAISAADRHKAAVALLQADQPHSVDALAHGRTRAAASAQVRLPLPHHLVRETRPAVTTMPVARMSSSPEYHTVTVLRALKVAMS